MPEQAPLPTPQPGLPWDPPAEPREGTYTEHMENHCSLSPFLVGEDVPGELMQG